MFIFGYISQWRLIMVVFMVTKESTVTASLMEMDFYVTKDSLRNNFNVPDYDDNIYLIKEGEPTAWLKNSNSFKMLLRPLSEGVNQVELALSCRMAIQYSFKLFSNNTTILHHPKLSIPLRGECENSNLQKTFLVQFPCSGSKYGIADIRLTMHFIARMGTLNLAAVIYIQKDCPSHEPLVTTKDSPYFGPLEAIIFIIFSIALLGFLYRYLSLKNDFKKHVCSGHDQKHNRFEIFKRDGKASQSVVESQKYFPASGLETEGLLMPCFPPDNFLQSTNTIDLTMRNYEVPLCMVNKKRVHSPDRIICKTMTNCNDFDECIREHNYVSREILSNNYSECLLDSFEVLENNVIHKPIFNQRKLKKKRGRNRNKAQSLSNFKNKFNLETIIEERNDND